MKPKLLTRLYHFLQGPNPLHPDIWNGRLSPLVFRRFEPADLAQCLELYSLNEPGRFPAGFQEEYRKCLAEDRTYTLVCEQQGRIIAAGGIGHLIRKDIATLCFGLVHPGFQGKGVGTALLLARLSLLNPDKPVYQVLIFSLAKSIGFYWRFGFRPFSPWKDKHGHAHPSAYLMFRAQEIHQCRKLLEEHRITVPLDEKEIPIQQIPAAGQQGS